MKIIRIKDYYGKYQEVPVSDELFEEWRKLNNDYQRNYRREIYHRSAVPIDEAEVLHAVDRIDDLVDRLICEERDKRLHEAISRLTTKQMIRVLKFMENMSYSDIARSEGVNCETVRESMQYAFKKLRAYMREFE